MQRRGEENEFYLLNGFEDSVRAGEKLRFGPVFRVFNFIHAKKRFLFHEHRHLEFELIMPMKGLYKCLLNGEELTIPLGCGLLIQPGDVHQDIYSRNMEYAGAVFALARPGPPDYVERIFMAGIATAAQIARLGSPELLLAARGKLESRESSEDGLFIRQAVSSILHTIFWDTLSGMDRRLFAPEFLEPSRNEAFRERLFRIFRQQGAGKLSLDSMAATLKISKSGLSHKCRELLGESPSSAFRNYKLDRARAMLRQGASAKEASDSLGFANQFHFSRAFKKRFGAPPSEMP